MSSATEPEGSPARNPRAPGGPDVAEAEQQDADPETPAPRAPAPAGDAPCANCGHPRSGRYCPKCGQNDRDYVRSLPPLLGDILKETFELDSRIRRTVGPLFLRPGELASEFSRSRRARYLSPVRMYLVASIGFFFLVSLAGDLQRPRAERLVEGEEPARLAEARASADIDALKALLPPPQQNKVDAILARPGMFLAKSILYQMSANLEDVAGDPHCADCWFDGWDGYLLARAVDVLEDPAEGFSLLLDSLPFALFVTLPAYALLLMAFFLGSRRFYTEHLVFAVQLHTFAFIVFAATVAIPDDDDGPGEGGPRISLERQIGESGIEAAADAVGPPAATDASPAEPEIRVQGGGSVADWVELLLFLWVLVYHYLALRRYYGNGRFRTALKCIALTVSYGILLIPGMLLSLAIAVVRLG